MSNPIPTEKEVMRSFSRQMRWMNIAIVLFLATAVWFFSGGPDWLFPKENVATTQVATSEEDEETETYAYPYETDEETGLLLDQGVSLVKGSCLSCHSDSIIINTRASREDWLSLIDWMQETQGLWDLGENEAPIVDYLSKHYGVSGNTGGPFVKVEEWYEID